jgi:hypothetical protein
MREKKKEFVSKREKVVCQEEKKNREKWVTRVNRKKKGFFGLIFSSTKIFDVMKQLCVEKKKREMDFFSIYKKKMFFFTKGDFFGIF